MDLVESPFARSEALLGEEAMKRLAAARVLVVGVGGVGSWCAEALVRTGLGHVTLMDDDVVAESNVNRQCPATAATIGWPKVEAMAERLRAINPQADVIARFERFEGFEGFEKFDVVVDAIDSVDCKAELILGATEAGVPLVSSMGAALRLDPTKVRVTRFEKVEGDGLARALRQRFRRLGRFPGRFAAVWSTETPRADGGKNVRGSIMPVTAAFGMALAGEIIRRLADGAEREANAPSVAVRAVVALGSNIEPRGDYIARALAALGRLPSTRLLGVSAVEETEPVDVPEEFRDRRFLNCVAIFETCLEAAEFSRRMHAIEDELGRVRTVRNGPRTIDLDLVDFGGMQSDDPELTLPHPRARERDFVWRPWRELERRLDGSAGKECR